MLSRFLMLVHVILFTFGFANAAPLNFEKSKIVKDCQNAEGDDSGNGG